MSISNMSLLNMLAPTDYGPVIASDCELRDLER